VAAEAPAVTAIASEELATLQSRLLDAVVTHAPLEPAGEPVSFPDIELVLRHTPVYVLDENLGTGVDPHAPVRLVSNDELAAAAREVGDVAYLRFQPADAAGDTVRLTLEARLTSAEPRPALGLSGIQVTFAKDGDRWRAVGPPTLFAA
jgi:hypothetical protein